MLGLKWVIFNQVVDRGSDAQPQVVGNLNKLR